MNPKRKVNLLQLDLSNAPVTPAGLREIARLPRLMFVRLAGSWTDDKGVVALNSMQTLRGIDLSRTRVTDGGVAALTLSNVDAMDLSGTQVTDAGIAQLRIPATRFVLRIADLPVSVDTVQSLKARYPNCRIDRRSDGTLGNFVQ